MKRIIPLTLLAVSLFAACKKDNKVNPTGTTPTNTSGLTPTTNRLDQIKDSIYLYEKEDYYWNDQLPAYSAFNPRSYTATSDINALTKEVDAISQIPINPTTNKPYEYNYYTPGSAKYSFVDDGTVGAELGGTKGDFGFNVFYQAYNDLRISMVDPGSPADLASPKLVRGYQIVAINDNTDLAYNPNSTSSAADPALVFLNNALSQQTIKLTLKKQDGTTFTVNLTAGTYNVKPVLTYKTFDEGNGKIVGYMVFTSFTDLNGNAKQPLDEAFNYFAANNVTDLVIDLRYNGGGSVETAEYLSNLIVPKAKSGSLMYTTYFNSTLQNDNFTLFAKQYTGDNGAPLGKGTFKPSNWQVNFNKQNALSVNRVFFIVTGNTASASELTINNLRPEMTVQLIGNTTYGKPVGFFPFYFDDYALYSPNFETKNSQNQGGYYAGMTPGTSDYPGYRVNDDITKDFGDPTEQLLASALNYIKNNTYTTSLQTQSTNNTSARRLTLDEARTVSQYLTHRKFTGMVLKNNTKIKNIKKH